MSENEPSDTESSSFLTSFLFHTVIVYPLTSYILKSSSRPKNLSIFYAILFLLTLAVSKIAWEAKDMTSVFTVLGVTRSTSALEIKKSYKRLSLILHPDKNPSANANFEFSRLKEAYDIAMNVENRQIYMKFGMDGIKNNKSVHDESAILMDLALYYATWSMLVFILTLGKTGGLSRTYIYTGMIVMLLCEVTLLTSSTSPNDPSLLPSWFLPSWTEYEIIWLMHEFFTPYMNGCRVMAGYLFVDHVVNLEKKVDEVRENVKDVLLVLRDLQINYASGGGGGGGGGRVQRGGNSTNDSGGDDDAQIASPQAIHQPQKIRDIQQLKLQRSSESVTQAINSLRSEALRAQNEKNGLFGNIFGGGNGMYVMVLGYCVIAYLFNK